jgi:hypothetical protein
MPGSSLDQPSVKVLTEKYTIQHDKTVGKYAVDQSANYRKMISECGVARMMGWSLATSDRAL